MQPVRRAGRQHVAPAQDLPSVVCLSNIQACIASSSWSRVAKSICKASKPNRRLRLAETGAGMGRLLGVECGFLHRRHTRVPDAKVLSLSGVKWVEEFNPELSR